MKIKTVNFDNIDNDSARVEVLEDDEKTFTTVNIDTANKTENQIKQEIKDVVNARKIKRDNRIILKQKLEDKTI